MVVVIHRSDTIIVVLESTSCFYNLFLGGFAGLRSMATLVRPLAMSNGL